MKDNLSDYEIVSRDSKPPRNVLRCYRKKVPIEAYQVTRLVPIDQGDRGWEIAWPGDYIIVDADCPYRMSAEKFHELYEEIV